MIRPALTLRFFLATIIDKLRRHNSFRFCNLVDAGNNLVVDRDHVFSSKTMGSSNVVQGPVGPGTLAGIRDRPLVCKCSVDANGFKVILT